ncbi:LOW QUALITY PROTEIN: calmodulin-regulated spectrin-associated protein 3 [Colossoma macropomum]|uniref:LOW QUALITY PROTEIN: calmodulin-regulated spectrin-associated protein 3 n=1 Tax=Colossoma macropomum TaxID=42526 RepID=UPI001863A616|nr:LOW QUALITY PROTEIN: calmodulin-regulated spectrin-associated protein 3 [Colossoma macropomum]
MVDTAGARRPELEPDVSVPEITPLDRYDPGRARSRAGIRWLIGKAYGRADNIPADLSEALADGQSDDGFGSAVERVLLSSELYCSAFTSLPQAVSQTHTGSSAPPRDHGSLLQVLQHRGLAPTHSQKPITDAQLTCKPVNMGAHLAVIESLMTLAAMETVGAVKMAKEADQFGDGASWENSLLFWINKLNQKLRESTEADDAQKSQPCTDLQPAQPSCPTRWYWKLVPHAIAFCLKESGKKPPVIRYRKDKVRSKQTPTFSVVSGVKDLSNGCAIAAAIHFYCPQLLPLEDVCLKDTMSVADSLHNLQLIREFCNSHLKGCCPLVLEDLLYTPPVLRVNIMCFLSELLAVFEVQKPDFVKPTHTLDLTDASGMEDCTSPISGTSGSPSFLFKQPLLPISSPSSPGGKTEGLGWSKKQISRPLSAVTFSIPFPLDSDVDVVMGNPLFRSVSTDSLTNLAPYTPPEDLSKLIGQAPLGELPTIEEALQVIHTGRSVRNEPEGAPAGFFLHSPENEDKSRLSSSAPCRSGMMYRPIGGSGRRGGGVRRPVDCSRDDDSVLRDGSIDSDASEDFSTRSNPGTPSNGPKGGRMTSFAEQRKKLPESPVASRVQGLEEPSSPMIMSPAGAAEAQELGARLEEKRRAIEEQKRRIEAIFAKHRQRLGKSAFLQLQREQGEGANGGRAKEETELLSLDERLTRMEEELKREEEREKQEEKEKEKKKEEAKEKAPPKLEKQVTFSVEPKKGAEKEPPLVEYNEAVSKLSSALQSLQRDMQRLTEQQQKLMGQKTTASPPAKTATSSRKTPPSSKAWVIPAGPKNSVTPSARKPQSSRDFSPSGSPSKPSASDPKSPKASASTTPRRLHNSTPKSPKRQHPTRPCDLSFPPLTRVLTPPQNVDTLPHLRRVSPSQCQVQTCSSLRLGGPRTPQEPASAPVQESSSESGSSTEHTPLFTLELETCPPPPPSVVGPVSVGGGSSSGAPSECSFESDVLLSAPLRLEEGETDQEQPDIFSSDSMSDHTETESRAGVGIYYKEGGLFEEQMALKKALLLERQQRRAEEIKRRRQEQENSRPCSTDELCPSVTPPLSQSLPTTHTVPPPPQATPLPSNATPPGTPQRRGAFTRAEYERRQQLKIMADLEKVLKQKNKKQSTTNKNNSHSPRKEKPAEQANSTQTNGPLLTNKTNSVSDSPSKLMSPGRPSNQNGDKDWENGSNASSPASIPEYTGPKLFKEPSFKSNKFIIHNALSRCCLAGKVNESQKNKIIEEMEKSSANHFLILLRDSNCQFRAIYTLDGQSDELQRLCGVGPRTISCSAVQAIYKYSSDRKQFSALPSRTVSMSVDAFTIPAHLWQSKKQSTPKKAATPK